MLDANIKSSNHTYGQAVPHAYSYTTYNLLLILEKENKQGQKKAEKRPENHKEINDYDYKRQADFEGEGAEEISGEGQIPSARRVVRTGTFMVCFVIVKGEIPLKYINQSSPVRV